VLAHGTAENLYNYFLPQLILQNTAHNASTVSVAMLLDYASFNGNSPHFMSLFLLACVIVQDVPRKTGPTH
jgi:hypothetical protein